MVRDTVTGVVTYPAELAGSLIGSLFGSATAPLTDGLFKIGLLALGFLALIVVVV